MFERSFNAVYCLITVTLGLLAASIYTTATIDIAKDFQVHDDSVQMGVFVYLLGNAATAPFYGAFSDQFGRKQILIWGYMLFIIGSFLIFFSFHLPSFLLGRLLQGVGAGAFSVVAIAAIQDIRTPAQGAKVMGWVSVFAGPAPIVGPIIGGTLSDVWGWRSIFGFCCILGVVMLGALFFLAETAPRMPKSASAKQHRWHRVVTHVHRIVHNYGMMLSNKQFMIYALQSPFITCGFWCAITVYPLYFMRTLGIDRHEYSQYSECVAFVYAVGLYILSKSVDRFGLEKTLSLGLKFGIFVGILHLIFSGFLKFSLGPTFVFLGLYMICMSLTFSPSVSRSMQLFNQDKGCAAAISNSLRKVGSATGAFLASILDETSLIYTSLIMIAATAIPYLLLKFRGQTNLILP